MFIVTASLLTNAIPINLSKAEVARAMAAIERAGSTRRSVITAC